MASNLASKSFFRNSSQVGPCIGMPDWRPNMKPDPRV